MQVALTVVGTLAALARWGAVRGIGSLIGGLLFGAVIPFTLIVIFPTNERACLTWISPHRRSDRCWTAGGRSTPSAVRTVGLQPRMVLRRFHTRQD